MTLLSVSNKTNVILCSVTFYLCMKSVTSLGLPGGPMFRSLPASAGDLGSTPGLGGFHMLQGSKAHTQALSLCGSEDPAQPKK